ncbi:MAG: ATP-binding protein [bacterium]|nr:ATP-binding protein [bacterium]
MLYFDAPKMEEVVFNLVSNAIKFTPPGGRITVEVRTSRSLPGSSGPGG